MARRNRKNVEEEVELDEVDSFNANREKILLSEAGEYARADYSEESSEEEVMGVEEGESESEEEGVSEGSDEEDIDEEDAEEEDEERGWGGKQNYYGGDEVSDDEDAKQMTEEALRQQRKHLQELEMDDYIDEDMMEGWEKAAETFDKQESKAQMVLSTESSYDKLEEPEQLKLLKQSFPEFVPLLKELSQLKVKLDEFHERDTNPLIEVKSVALSAYLAAVSSYFAIFVDNLRSGEPFTSMKDNPIMETILSTREVWRQANELPEVAIERNTSENEESSEEVFVDAREDITEEEDEDIEQEVAEYSDEQEEEEEEEEEDTVDIDVTKKRTIKRNSRNQGDTFTETDIIDDVDMEDKQRRKKTLRFYTSKIDQAAAKNNKSYSGDLDVPYKERLFERQQRLIEEARKRGLAKPSDQDYQSGDDDDQIKEDNDDYYDSIKQSKLEKKQSRKHAHEVAVKAAKEGKLAELQEELGADGKRAINYQILKNKGLTPHRKKEYRNARVKKRKQYEKAKKKLKSVRQVYDESNRGPYQGEKTGIKKGLSRSVKLV